MNIENPTHKEIDGKSKSVSELLKDEKYTIDFYQREYKWGEKQVKELVNDLVNTFQENYDKTHVRKDVKTYGEYFLGSIIISLKNGQNFIIDGQQRLTSLSIFLMYLNNIQKNNKVIVAINDFIYSDPYGEPSFNIDIPERTNCMMDLYNYGYFDSSEDTESTQNITKAYDYISEAYPDDLRDEALPCFIDWIIRKVILIKITTYSDQDAYRVFETMNDRGLSLTPTEMLKGYLLSFIRDEREKLKCNELWKNRVKDLIDIEKDEDADCIKTWLRSKYANTIRVRKKAAEPLDYDKIGTGFHRWVRENDEILNLKRSEDYSNFILEDFNFFSNIYLDLQQFSRNYSQEHDRLYFISQIGFTLQHQVLLAPLNKEDSEETLYKKLRVVSIYLDIMLHRRIWNFRSISYSTMSYAIFILIKEIRNKPLEELSNILTNKLNQESETFINSRYPYRLHGTNNKQIRNILMRLTYFVELNSEINTNYEEYINAAGKKRYEVEHIFANKPERYLDDFKDSAEFDINRNLIGGLLLLPKSFNASYGDLEYEDKFEHYFGQNILAKSLHPKAYKHNPGFLKFIESNNLQFKSYDHFNLDSLLERQKLFNKLAELIWSPSLINR